MLKITSLLSLSCIMLLANTTYDKSIKDEVVGLNYWTNTTNMNSNDHSLVGSNEVFTIGSRQNIPLVTKDNISVLTNKLCSDDLKQQVSCIKENGYENRYTDNGLIANGETKFVKWYKADTSKTVNGVTDNPCASLDNNESITPWVTNYALNQCERRALLIKPVNNSDDILKYLNLNSDPSNLSCFDVLKIITVTNHTYVAGDNVNWEPEVINKINNNTIYINDQKYNVANSYLLSNNGNYASHVSVDIQNTTTNEVFNYPISHVYDTTIGATGSSFAHHFVDVTQTDEKITSTLRSAAYRNSWCSNNFEFQHTSKSTCDIGYTYNGLNCQMETDQVILFNEI